MIWQPSQAGAESIHCGGIFPISPGDVLPYRELEKEDRILVPAAWVPILQTTAELMSDSYMWLCDHCRCIWLYVRGTESGNTSVGQKQKKKRKNRPRPRRTDDDEH